MAPFDWVQEVGHECETLHKEVLVVSVVSEEANEVWKMILEQHNLLESCKTNLLTVLAFIFIPMSFVASVFGMNTHETNGSAWQLKYYFTVALPFAVLTVLLPLIILSTFNLVLEHLATYRVIQGLLRWSLVITTLVLNLHLDIIVFTDPSTSSHLVRLLGVYLDSMNHSGPNI